VTTVRDHLKDIAVARRSQNVSVTCRTYPYRVLTSRQHGE